MNCINSSNRQIIALSAQLETLYHGLHNLHMITQVCGLTTGFHGIETAVDQPDCLQALIHSNELAIQAISLITGYNLKSNLTIELLSAESVVIIYGRCSGHYARERA